MQWPFSSKKSAPQLLSFSARQNEKHGSSTEFDFELSRNNYPVSQHLFLKKRMTTSPSVHRSVVKSGQNLVSSPTPWPSTSVPVTSCGSSFVGTMDVRSASKTSSAADQLTIFYNDSVSVYHNISPEKADAIMLLPGNELSVTTPVTFPPPVPVPVAVTEPLDLNHVPESDSAKRFEALGSISQFRRKSVARFLEKRQQRVMSMGIPYSWNQNKEISTNRRTFVLNSQDLCSAFEPSQTAERP